MYFSDYPGLMQNPQHKVVGGKGLKNIGLEGASQVIKLSFQANIYPIIPWITTSNPHIEYQKKSSP